MGLCIGYFYLHYGILIFLLWLSNGSRISCSLTILYEKDKLTKIYFELNKTFYLEQNALSFFFFFLIPQPREGEWLALGVSLS